MNTSKWDRKPLGAVADLCLGKMLDQNKNRGEPLPYLANVNVRWGEFSLDGLRTMRFEPKELDRYGLKFGDIVMCEGGEPGRCAIWKNQVPGMMIQKALHRIRPSEVLDYRFLHYSFLRIGQSKGFDQFFTGSTIKHLPLEKLAKVEVPVPPLPVQRRIAGILSAYDELIDNSQRRIRLLEAMARALYREWFVHFRFPGHEKLPRVASPLGDVPRGWEWRELNELGFLGRGKSRHRPRNEASLYGGPYPFFQTGDIKEARIFLRTPTQTYSEAGLSQSKLWQPGTLCITIAANIGETAILAKTGCIPDSVVGFVPDLEKSDAFYVKMYLDSIKQQMQNVSRGTTQDNLSVEKLLGFRVLTPPPSIIRAFRETISPVLEMLNLLLQKEENLRRTRDLLLPRLLSGQVATKSKEI
jgi:type I restriction enzyme, S subunit